MADLFSNLALGFSIALSPYTLMLAVIGCFLGHHYRRTSRSWSVKRRRHPDPVNLYPWP